MLDALVGSGVLAPIDGQLGAWLIRQGAPSAVGLAAAFASRAVRDGHVCFDLQLAQGAILDADGTPTGFHWPDLRGLVPPWVADAADVDREPGAEAAPLVRDGERLYLARYHTHERELARRLRAFASAEVPVDEAALEGGIEQLFDQAPRDDDQRQACRVAASRRLCVVSGGPGTGKTRTVASLIALLQQQYHRRGDPCRVRLLAPTGKAAARMAEAIAVERSRLPAAMQVGLPSTASTVHRALSAVGGSRTNYRRGASSPLPDDVVVVDEASMVDLAMMRRLVDAVRPDARLVLLGDRHQLASVESGAVLGEVARAATVGESPLAPCVVTLRHSFRFGGGISQLADAIRDGDAARALSVLTSGGVDGDVARIDRPAPDRLDGPVSSRVREGFRPLIAASGAAASLAALGRFRVLCAHRHGPWGVEGLNLAIERVLRAEGLEPSTGWYPKRPILITANDYRQELFNGDQGVVLDDPRGLRAVFPLADGVRELSVARLDAIETVFALSVHKSQGSEFDEVVVVLPPAGSPLLSRELLYTAVTRARRRLVVVGEPDVVAEAVQRPIQRSSGLEDKLRRAREG